MTYSNVDYADNEECNEIQKRSQKENEIIMDYDAMWNEIRVLQEKKEVDGETDIYLEKEPVEIEILLDFSECQPGIEERYLNNRKITEKLVSADNDSNYTDENLIKNELIRLIKENPEINTSAIIDKLDFDTWTILEVLEKLKKEGIIE